MSRPMHRTDTDTGWINRRFATIERRLREMGPERRLLHASWTGVVVPTAALENPVGGGFVSLTATNFATTTAGGTVINSTVTVPSGFTSAAINVTGRAYAVNSTAVNDYLLARVEFGATVGNALPVHAAPNGTAGDAPVNVCTLSTVLTGMGSGSTFPVRLWVASSVAGWTANAANVGELSGSIVWFR